ncbi:style cell-cycle inhibitor 1-A-like [Hibiscus syriacus]|uniref:style cell-cycle inhibitor 1-A-like n=1 Tax=Hibiscus syriacus TaxID=106335 RepID=UPI0019207E93|nr:style cell-cycle inhibitor 1-A-like [Hibiscus syriacus]
MGSDRKEKRSKKRSNSYSSGSEDEGREKRQRRGEDEQRKSRKKDDKKEKRKDKKSHKHSSDKEKKSKEKHKSKHHKGDRHSKHGFQEISSDDYFSKNNEFATWLKEEKRVFFSDLSSESAREFFADFVKDWNNQKLESEFYEGIASGPRTAHNWKIRQ